MRNSAGILFFIRDTKTNKRKFLLGKDSKYSCWSDFGGKCEDEDHDSVETAAREFYEESGGVFMTKYEAMTRIRHSSIMLKCTSYRNRKYCMYLVELFDNLPLLKSIESFNFFAPYIATLQPDDYYYRYKEKMQIALFDLDYIKGNSSEFRSVFYNSVLSHLIHLESA
tara:strand:+ start:299 stop:802 length:504 start_codon:yes stop_codon:yes gene_type:complete